MFRTLYISMATLIIGLVIGLNIDATPSIALENQTPLQLTVQDSKITDGQIQHMINRIESLEKTLHSEIEKREALSADVLKVKQKLDQNSQIPTTTLPHVTQTLEPTNENISTMENIPDEPEPAETRQQLLLTLGFSESTLENIKRREEQRELDQLYLRNQATREGWIGTARYTEESRKLTQQSNFYREELGDEKYDQYLFKSGQFNRVSVQSVISGSPAANAGIEAGDIIFSYDNERLFTWMELTELSSQGTPGETVAIQLQRSGEIMDVFIPRGPLGVRLSGTREAP